MSVLSPPSSPPAAAPAPRPPRARHARAGASLTAQGQPLIWLTGGALAVCLLMIIAFLALIVVRGSTTFWPVPLVQLKLHDGRELMGEVTEHDEFDFNLVLLRQAHPLTAARLRPLLRAALLERLALIVAAGQEPRAALALRVRSVVEADEALPIEQVLAEARIPPAPEQKDRVLAFLTGLTLEDSERAAIRDGLVQRGRAAPDQAWGQEAEAFVERLSTSLKDAPAAQAQTLARQMAQDREQMARLCADLMQVHALVHRRKLRTGNFEFTNEHFTWVTDADVAEGGESQPEWGLVVERTEKGRFYGVPRRFVVITERKIEPREQALTEALGLLEEMTRLGRESRAQEREGQAPRWPAVAALLSEGGALADDRLRRAVAADLQKVRDESIAQFLQGGRFPAGSQGLLVIDGSLTERTPDQVQAGDAVTGVAAVWTGPAAAWEQFQRHHPAVGARNRERRAIEKHQVGEEVSRVRETARLELRQAELKAARRQHEAEVARNPEKFQGARRKPVPELDVYELLKRRVELAARSADLQAQVQRSVRLGEVARQASGAEAALSAAAAALEAAVRRDVQARLAPLADEDAELKALLDKQDLEVRRAAEHHERVWSDTENRNRDLAREIAGLRAENSRYGLELVTADGRLKMLPADDVVLAYPANQLTAAGKWGIYFARWREFLLDDPREANSEGGVYQAIFGTVLMTLLMSLAVVPFGVLAALYLREYAQAGPVVSVVRIAINNLAGVPSIVFGVFGLAFFVYQVGDFIDSGPDEAMILEPGRWLLGLAALVLLTAGAVALSLWTNRASARRRPSRALQALGVGLWVGAVAGLVLLVISTPYFSGLYEAAKPAPTFSKPGVLWASLTLALLTLPVVIVATEEALAAVPSSMREGSYACGASKWQTIRRIVLPRAMPGIMTGMILAMARGAGEVAPLMLVGAAKLALELPVSLTPPFGLNQSFMHLGFHIYDVGFQSPNSEAAVPLVFTTTLLLILIIAVLNLAAIWLRTRLRRKFITAAF